MTLYGATARRWTLGLLVLPLLVNVSWAKAQTANPASATSSPAPSIEPDPVDNNRPPIVEEGDEKTPPRPASDSTLDPNSRRAGSLEPGEEARFFYWAQAQEAAGLLLFFATPDPDVTPGISKESEPSFKAKDCRYNRIEFLQTGQHQFKFRNSGSEPIEFSFILLSLSIVDLQKLEHGHEHRGEIATMGDVDVYAIDARDSVRLWLRLKFASSSAQEVALVVSPEQGVKYFNWGRTQQTGLKPEESGPLLVALSAAQSGATYRLQHIKEALEVLRLHAGEDSAIGEYDLPPKDERSIHLRIEDHEHWDLQIETIGETFHLQGKLAGSRFEGGTQMAGLSKSAAEVILRNRDPHPGKVRIKVSAPSASWWDNPYWILLLGCGAASLLFSLTWFRWSGPFNHLHFSRHHFLYCFVVAIPVFSILALLLLSQEPLSGQKIVGVPLELLPEASGLTGFFITLACIYAVWRSRRETHGAS